MFDEFQIGKKVWAFSAGKIPVESNGKEPEFLSNDRISVLNVTDSDAEIQITVLYADDQQGVTYKVKVDAKRVRKIRFNDLIDPKAMPLDKEYGALIKSDVPVVIQFLRQDTGRVGKKGFIVVPFFED
ncbi:MAG: sensory rhodopsin transducer [Cytophagaceae bacterium]